MKKIKMLSFTIGLLTILGLGAGRLRADSKFGKDIAVTGTVVPAIIDEATGKVYVLLSEHMDQRLPYSIKMGEKNTLEGDEVSEKGHTALRVENVKI